MERDGEPANPGGMQWAYSELFQEFKPQQVSGYLDHVIKQGERIGPLVHYSETHDNNRLAKRGREWSLMRNRLSALTSVNGTLVSPVESSGWRIRK